jgi:perosamine synthetase
MIPQFKPIIDRVSLAKEVNDYILSDGYFTEYLKTKEFEKTLAKYLEVEHCFMVNNGTISLSLALLAVGVKPGDKVIVPNITMIATYTAVQLIGAVPLIVDVDSNNLCLGLEKATELVHNSFHNIKAVIYVTLNGRAHPLKEYVKFENMLKGYGIALIEDNAQSLGSYYPDSFKISCPTNGIGSFSFSMPKIITTGQGGCLVTNDDKLANKIAKLKDFGRLNGGIDVHDSFGINSKFTEIQAIMGLNQFKTIDARVEHKKKLLNWYKEELKTVSHNNLSFLEYAWDLYTPWFIDIYVSEREKLIAYLKSFGIGTRIMYPELLSQASVKNNFWFLKSLPVSGQYTKIGLWLPSSFDLKQEDVKFICKHIRDFYESE